MSHRIAVIGGGLAGLCACRRLHQAGLDFVLLEARDRLGGRILSCDADGQPCEDGFDLGPSWFWPRAQPGMAALVQELGLAAFRQHSAGDVVFERMSREAPHRYRSADGDGDALRLAGGSGALIRALEQDLPPERLMTGARVTRLALIDQGVELTLSAADGEETRLTVAQVIAAAPPRLLAAGVAFSPPLPPETLARWASTATWMAPHAKFFALYDAPFWREAGLSGTAQSMVGPLAEIHDATTASGKAALFGFIGLGADQRAAVGREALTRACVEQLGRLFGPPALSPSAVLLKDWAEDPLTATPADRSAGGHPPPGRIDWVPPVWKDRLSLAASETSAAEPGYLAGAVDAAARAAAEAIARLQPSGSAIG